MVYSIVEFTNDKSVAAVPTCWFNTKTFKCAWPKSTFKGASAQKLVEKADFYNINDFDLYDARLFKSNIVSFQEANKKLKLYMVTSDISEMETTLERKRKNKQHVNNVKSKKPNKGKSKILFPQYPSSNSSNSSLSEIDDSDNDKTYSIPLNKSSVISPTLSIDINDVSPLISHKVVDKIDDQVKINASRNEFETTQEHAINNDGVLKIVKELVNKINYVDKQIAAIRYDNRSIFDTLDRMENKLDKIFGSGMGTSLQINNSQYDLMVKSPLLKTIENEEELQEFDKKLIENPEFRSQMVNELTRLMGINIKRSIKRIFEKLFSDTLLCGYSYHGIRTKKSFSSLNLCSIIFESIQKDPKFCNTQNREIEDVIQKYLAQRPFVLKRINKQVAGTEETNNI